MSRTETTPWCRRAARRSRGPRRSRRRFCLKIRPCRTSKVGGVLDHPVGPLEAEGHVRDEQVQEEDRGRPDEHAPEGVVVADDRVLDCRSPHRRKATRRNPYTITERTSFSATPMSGTRMFMSATAPCPKHRTGPDGSKPNLTPGPRGRRLGAMLGARTLVAVLVLFHVGLATAATFHTADFAWVPSYFDDDDGDFLPLLLSEQMPVLVDPGSRVGRRRPDRARDESRTAAREAAPARCRAASASGLPPSRSPSPHAVPPAWWWTLHPRGGCTCSD